MFEDGEAARLNAAFAFDVYGGAGALDMRKRHQIALRRGEQNRRALICRMTGDRDIAGDGADICAKYIDSRARRRSAGDRDVAAGGFDAVVGEGAAKIALEKVSAQEHAHACERLWI